MKNLSRFTSAALVFLFVLAGCSTTRHPMLRLSDYPGTIRIACIGDSITYGAGIENRESNSYPAVLGRLLGAKFATKNFGVNGATLLKKGDKPYWDQPEFAAVKAFSPQVVIIMLGTNDSKPQNWRYQERFADDLRAMIDHFSRLPSQPVVWICLPPPAYESRWGISEETIAEEIIPDIQEVADEKHVPLIDLHDALSNRPKLFSDTIHPNADGAALMAQTVQNALLGSR